MADLRERLIKFIMNAVGGCSRYWAGVIADGLMDNGVTDNNDGRKWIPVTERLPDKDGDYLVFKRFAGNAWSDVVSFAKDGRKVSECTFGKKWPNVWYYYDSEWGYIRADAVTHWMPLPEPPEEE